MNRLLLTILLILLSFLFISLQSTIFSPIHSESFHPDLNLILIVFLGLFSDMKGGAILAIGNGYMMDVLSGYLPGIHSISRLSVFIILKDLSEHVYSQSRITQTITIFSSTLFLWGFIWAALKLKSDSSLSVPLSNATTQAVVNTLVGLPIFWIIRTLHGKTQQ
jgi:rod shape-determining protein MreD